MPLTLSKSDFKVAQECPTKLYYRKQGFPNTKQEDAYLQMLAEGGYAVGTLAQLLFPDGVDLGAVNDLAEAERRTRDLLEQEAVVIFEAAVRHGAWVVRVDVLVKRGALLELIEVKSKSYDSEAPAILNKSGDIDPKWLPYIEDVAFQTLVLRRAFAEKQVVPYLMVPDKARTTAIDGLNSWFTVRSLPGDGRYRPMEVDFTGDAEAVRRDELLVRVPMEELVGRVLPEVERAAKAYAASLVPGLSRIPPERAVKCAKCEYRGASPDDPARDGFRQCWGTLADVTPSVLDLYRAGNFKEGINALIADNKVALSDVPPELLHKKDGSPAYHGRPLMQLTRSEEWIAEELRGELRNWPYPLHFIDFETSRMALPYHRGMRPYEQLAFQWSCHTLRNGTAEPEHRAWINTEDAFPSFQFARSLMQAIGDEGTILIWSHHELTTLRDIRRQMELYGEEDHELAAWLDRIAPSKASGMEPRLVDMNALAVRGYFHPSTRGKTSIKFTLPAVLNAHRSKRIAQWLQHFDAGVDLLGLDAQGLINPYKLLPAIQLIDRYGTDEEEDEYNVNEGTGAMRAYQDMLYGQARNDAELQERLRQGLLTYCKLDTLAMVIIWEHWRQ